jgi:hypothetical protein
MITPPTRFSRPLAVRIRPEVFLGLSDSDIFGIRPEPDAPTFSGEVFEQPTTVIEPGFVRQVLG